MFALPEMMRHYFELSFVQSHHLPISGLLAHHPGMADRFQEPVVDTQLRAFHCQQTL